MLTKKKRWALMRRRMKQEEKIASQFVNLPLSSANKHDKFHMKVLK
jgi:hypothetical protein